ncbi:hypothetical protein EDB80DRAFT_562303 [Ilyonectria destructans]|nr:hypothetical protein EDB80DRAFT_562303 [Ilyonectria destructans]
MSLYPEDHSRKGRSRSRSRDRRSKDEPAAEPPSSYADVREPSYIYPEDDLDDRYKGRNEAKASGALPYPEEGGMDSMLPGGQALYSYDSQQPTYKTASPATDRSSRDKVGGGLLPGAFPDDEPRVKGKGEEPRIYSAEPRDSTYENNKFKFLPQKYSRWLSTGSSSQSSDHDNDKDKKGRDDDDLAYGKPPVPKRPPPGSDDLAYGKTTGGKTTGAPAVTSHALTPYGSNAPHDDHDRRRPVDDYDRRRYESPDEGRRHSPTAEGRSSRRRGDSILKDPQSSSTNVLTVEPGSRDRERSRDRRKEKSSSTRGSSDMLTVDSGRKRDKSKSRDKSRERSRDHRRDKSPAPDMLSVEPGRRDRSRSRDGRGSSSLSVDTGRVAGMSLAMAPGSPLLESYYGTYQDCSPMPSPLLLATQNQGDDTRGLEPLSPLSSDFEGDGKKRNRRARFHDPEDITSQLAQALRGSKRPDTGPLIDILPSLTHEQVMELRAEYKRLVKTGSERKGVNVAKHIRARLKDEDPLLMKACYAVALGMWESEAYWANFWYQGDKTRRELLIESLMGRTNDEIRAIKDAFSDKKYDNSLTKCMKTELKEDKFKKAVLMVLEERRMDEYDGYGRQLPIDYQLVSHDVSELRRAVRSDKGGETAMIGIVVQRSESHLRAVLQEYEHNYHSNFARDALKKSGNLVGELLAHVLNGVINRPVRDALLLHHAITGSRKDGLRRELLISRLVRYHWDPPHMRAVKQAYRERYGKGLSEAVRESTSGEWGLFCRELCIARTPDDVRRFEKVAVSVR